MAMQRSVYEQKDLVGHLRELGLEPGDAVLVRADLGKIGRVRRPGDQTLVQSLREAVGARGTVLALTHSPAQLLFRRDAAYVFDPATAPCVTGRFAEAVLAWPGAHRSRHPTCSMTGIGPAAADLLAAHDHRATCFGPMKDLIGAGGKMLVIGCTDSSPGFSTAHHAYEVHGLATRSLLSGLVGCYFRHGGRVRWFNQRDVPGCSLGFHKFYPLYRQAGVLRAGRVGSALAFLIGAAEAYRVEYEVVLRAPAQFLCDAPACFSCRGSKWFNAADMPAYFLRQAPRKVFTLLRRAA
jgi:aminoglycoside N3'-acetyltransferase